MRKNQNYLKKQFYNYSLVVLLSLTVIIVFAMAVLYREQYLQNIEVQSQLSVNVQNQIDSSLKEMDKIINGLLFNKSFVQAMKETSSSAEYIDYNNQMMENFISLDAPLFSTFRIIAFNDNAYYTLTKTGESSSYIKEAGRTYRWKDEVLAADGKKVILPPHPDDFDDTGEKVYSVARTISDGKYHFGFVEVQNLYSHLEEICSLNPASGSVVLYSAHGEVLYPADCGEDERILFENIFQEIGRQQASAGSFRRKGHQISYQISDYSGWISIVYCPVISFIPYGMNLILMTLAVYVLLAVFSLFMIGRTARRMAAPLMELNHAISEVTLENMTFQPHIVTSISEINNINQSFQQMLEHLQEAIARSIQSQAGEERANYLALQAQMHPHTLYNTLSMIESVSYMHGDKEVSGLCVCLSQMLRYISDYSKREYTVQDELTHLEQYATLVQKRYEGKLEITVHADPALLSVIIPKFTIQPLVENAVKHSFATRIASLSICVELTVLSEGGWSLKVEDNGPGFTQEALEKVRRQFEECDRSLMRHQDVINTKIGNLGLSNIYVRGRILYGRRFRMQVGNRENGGGCINITVTQEESHDERISCGR